MPHLRPHGLAPAGLALLLGLAGCAGLNDPFEREGTWRPEAVNDANLGAMVVDPAHLVQGVGDPESPGALSAAAIRRLLTGHVKPLPNTDIATVTPSGQPSSAGADAGGGGEN